MAVGYIYALLNESFRGLVKIGKSTRHPNTRAAELSGTGVPHPYLVAYYERVSDCDLAEKLVHEELKEFRKNPNREFFRVSPRKAVKVIQRISIQVNRQKPFPQTKPIENKPPVPPPRLYGISFSCAGCGNYRSTTVPPFATTAKCPSCEHENVINMDWSNVPRG